MSKRNNKRKNSKGRSNFTPRQREVESVDMKSQNKDARMLNPRESDNDWRWYAQNPELVRDFASFPFAFPVGTKLDTKVPGIDSGAVPGIMALYFSPQIGEAVDETSPINVAMRQLFAEVRKRNSGRVNYDASFMMQFILAEDSALMYLSYLKRIYGVLRNYTVFNRYYAKAIVEAMGVSYENACQNMYALKGLIDIFASKLSALAIPSGFTYVARHSWMCENLYVDSSTPKAQTYMYVPAYYYKFSVQDNGSGVKIGTVSHESPGATNFIGINAYAYGATVGNNLTVQQLADFADNLLNPMLEDQDFNIMSGDIMKAFGPSGIVVPTGIDANYQVFPVYNREVLSQIENATVLFGAQDLTMVQFDTTIGGGFLKQVGNIVENYSAPKLGASEPLDGTSLSNILPRVHGMNKMLNFHDYAPTPEMVMVATRLSMSPNPNSNPDEETYSHISDGVLQINYNNFATIGSEVITGAKMFYFMSKDSNWTLCSDPISTWMLEFIDHSNGTYKDISLYNAVVARYMQFDWAPHVVPVIVAYVNAGSGYQWQILDEPVGIFADTDYYTFITTRNLREMTQVALLSEFTPPPASYQG